MTTLCRGGSAERAEEVAWYRVVFMRESPQDVPVTGREVRRAEGGGRRRDERGDAVVAEADGAAGAGSGLVCHSARAE